MSNSMACLDMYNQNSQHKGLSVSPRISFSNDFVESSHSHDMQMRNSAPVSSDFEFSVSNYSMMSADQLFFKGKILPFKESCSSTNKFQKITTLRDELQNEDDDGDFSLRPPKNPAKWRGFLGLRRSQLGVKKSENGEGSRPDFHRCREVQTSKNSQDSVE